MATAITAVCIPTAPGWRSCPFPGALPTSPLLRYPSTGSSPQRQLMTRLFSDEQLAEMAQPFEYHALQALRHGDIEAVRHWLDEMAKGPAGLDALSGHTLARKVGKLRQDLGEEKARHALVRIGEQQMKTWVAQYRRGDVAGAIADLVAVFKHQG